MKSLRKTSAVLDCFTRDARRLTLAEIAARTGLPKTTVHRQLAALREIGFLVQDGRRDAYRLGFRLLALGGVVLADVDLMRHARGPAETLTNQSGEAVHICVFDGRNVVSIERREMEGASNEIVRIEREPPHCTSTGKAILSTLGEADCDLLTADLLADDELPRFGPNTITDRTRLRRDLAVCRARGYAVDDEERNPGVRCVGAPIRRHGTVVGAISVTGPAPRFPDARLPALAEMVMATAAKIGLNLER
ncbi:MAG: IclR family transcriptional regulator [Thalassobaculaceae bacterium]|nr:IclR family transcriptional regulator [Thalassobaculaceae bacterium]